jgi:pyruvate,water dikinase
MSATPRPGTYLVLDFADIDGGMLTTVGGKAANLGELIRAELPVPTGFCLTTEAYRQATASAGLEEIFAELEGTPATDVTALAALAARARAAVLAASVPTSVTVAVVESYARIGVSVPVAVRSSATAEDLPFASFAGQQDTYLNIVGEGAVLEAVRHCWASLWTDRAVVYRATNGIDNRMVRLAVVVQRMVDSAVAGVLFTANPVTGRRRQAVIDASPGLGESVVSGAVNPDHFVVDTASGTILDRRLGDKRLSIRSLPWGGTEHVMLDPDANTFCITDEQALNLARLGYRVEEHYGVPQDIEWAIDGAGMLWLTQARPITTLYPLPAGAPAPEAEPRVYFCFSVAQRVFRPITPAGLAAFRLIGSGASRMFGFPVTDPLAGPAVLTEAGQRVFIDVTGAVRSRGGRTLIPKVLGVMEARSAAVFRELFTDSRLSVTQRSWLPFLRHVGRVAFRYRLPSHVLHALAKPDQARTRVEALDGKLDMRLAVPDGLTAEQRLDWIAKLLQTEIAPMLPQILPPAAAGFIALGLAIKLLGADANGDVQSVLRGIPHNVTTEMDLELWHVAMRIGSDRESAQALRTQGMDELARLYVAGTLPDVAQRELRTFLRRYGHRAIAEIDLGMPRWSDDPRYILGVLANYLRMGPEDSTQSSPDRLFAQGAAEAEAMVETLSVRAARRGRLRGEAVRMLLGRVRALAGVRELPKYYLVRVIAAARAQLRLVGEELHKRGRLAEPDDVYFVDLAQARAGLHGIDLREAVTEARRAYDDELRRHHIPRVMLSDGNEPEAGMHRADVDGSLIGTAASAGTVTGTARVILDPVGAHLEPGEILVCPSTDPAWTPLFLTAGGLVMEMGGANSHGAVVAREYGIPAVVGVPDAVATITTGQQITVNGTTGTVALA